MNNIGEGIFQGVAIGVAIIVIFVFALGVLIGKNIWDNDGFIESKTVIQPMIKLTTDGKKVDTLYVYKIK
jgi:hypothetical protein